ncbi:GntR family transcriptional regulator [Clostridium sp. MSJ-8]|uniref:GntR family transcriptional regulator n=1 Tax=Clostridium sp. MSJ-8 TaxID=2841510 RepID=UPI001C0EE96C|nr:GntR family transcriptional regulator [Clostridium sp. MSJ-8]MBU5487727.1 GntR family transcriptional regulator [Clostridium sp. MSJ-8]
MGKILDDLLLDICDGRYKENDKLPSSNELACKYGVSRMKVREEYRRLEEMGYVYSLQGRGIYLAEQNKIIELTLSGESFSKKLTNQGYNLETKIIYCDRIPYNEKVYSRLKAGRMDEIYKIGRLRIVDNEPVAIHISYLPKRIFPNIHEEAQNIYSICDYYNQKGIKYTSIKETVLSIVFPEAKERKLLNCRELVPLIKLENEVVEESSGDIIEYTEIMYRSDRFKYKI